MIFDRAKNGRVTYRGITWRKMRSRKDGTCSLTGRKYKSGEVVYRPETHFSTRTGKIVSASNFKDRMVVKFVEMAMAGIG